MTDIDSKTMAKVSVGTSVLTRDLVWCECGRGLSLSGKWIYCPKCGHPIDQESYHSAVEEAKSNAASLFYIDSEERTARVEAENYIQVLESALQSIRDLKVDQFDHPPEEWAKHTPETCEECKRWNAMKHPLQHSCDGWYRLYYSREKRINDDQERQHWAMRNIAREALTKRSVPE